MKLYTLAVALVLLPAAIAHADPDPAKLFRDGQAAYNDGRYDDAIAAWQHSYDLSKASALFYNLAQAYRLRGHRGDCASARHDYQRFLKENPSPSPERPLAERYIAELEACAKPSAPTTAPAAAESAEERDAMLDQRGGASSLPTAPDESADGNHTVIAVGLGGVGLAVLATGLYFGHRASSLADEVTDACARPGGCDWAQQQGKDSDGRHDATVGRVLDVVGLCSIVAGGAVYLLGARDSGVRVRQVATPGQRVGTIFVWEGSW